MRILTKALCLAAVAVAFNSAAQSAPILLTSEVGYAGPQLDFSSYANGTRNSGFGTALLPGGITLVGPANSMLGQGNYGLDANGIIQLPATYAGLEDALDMTLTFASPVSEFGGFFNYTPGHFDDGRPTIAAYDVADNLLVSFDLELLAPISTPGAINQFLFRGIQSDSSDIKSFKFSGGIMVLAGTANGDLVSAVPEPTALLIFATGLVMLGWFGYGKKKGADRSRRP